MNAQLAADAASAKALVVGGLELASFDAAVVNTRDPFPRSTLSEPAQVALAAKSLGAAVSLICPNEFGRAQKLERQHLRNEGVRVYTYESVPLLDDAPTSDPALSTSGQRSHEGLLVSVPDQYTVDHAIRRCNVVLTRLSARTGPGVNMPGYVLNLPATWRRFVATQSVDGVLPAAGVADFMQLDATTGAAVLGAETLWGEEALKALFRKFKSRFIAVLTPGGQLHLIQSGRKYVMKERVVRDVAHSPEEVFATLSVALHSGWDLQRAASVATGG